MESNEKAFNTALAKNTSEWMSIVDDKRPAVAIFSIKGYFVVCNETLVNECDDFITKNHLYIDKMFPSEFKCFKLDENTIARLLLVGIWSDGKYEISYSNRFALIEDKLYLVKTIHCGNKDNIGFAMMKYDLIENDASLGSLMYMNQNVNLLLKKVGGICENEYAVLKADGMGKVGLIDFTIELYGMLDLIASGAYLRNITNVQDNRIYVEAGNYKLPNFDTIDNVRKWLSSGDNGVKCPFINMASIAMKSNHVKLRNQLNKLYKPRVRFIYRVIKKSNKTVCEF